MSKEYVAYHILVVGRVQHVGFRFWTECLAIKLNVKGYVKNLSDENTVEVEVEGYSDRVEEFIKAISKDHPYAKVTSIEKEKISVKKYKIFKIIR